MGDLCAMKIAVCAATNFELDAIKKLIPNLNDPLQNLEIVYCITGVGLMHATYSFSMICKDDSIQLIVQAGIAGSFDVAVPIGTACVVENEYSGDLGVEENGTFRDVFDMKLVDMNTEPYVENKLHNPWLSHYKLSNFATIDAVTVNAITTSKSRIEQLKTKYNCITESMEGAALHYVGLRSAIPFLQIRTISNYVGERNKAKWNIPLALENLGQSVTRLLVNIDRK